MYVDPNYPSKKAFKEALAAGKLISVFSPGPFPSPVNGWTMVEGPHYPKPHRWYARVRVENAMVVEVAK